MKNLELARTLLDSAGRNIFVLRGAVDTPGYPDEIFGFHAQQAAEKSFKAWLALFDEPFPLSHDLTLLSDSVKAVDMEASRFHKLLRYTPTPFSSVTRRAQAINHLTGTQPCDSRKN